MNKIILIFGICVACLFSGCSDPKKLIVGKWQEGDKKLEFKEDGTWVSNNPDKPIPIWGTYAVQENGKDIRMNYANPPFPEVSVIEELHVTEEELTITIYEDQKHHFVREGAEVDVAEHHGNAHVPEESGH